MIRVRRVILRLLDQLNLRHASVVLQAGLEVVPVIISRAVRLVISQSPEQRLVQDGIWGYVPRRAAVEREADV